MDLWNNAVGREIGAISSNRDEIARKVAEALNSGLLITNESDTRIGKWGAWEMAEEYSRWVYGWFPDSWNPWLDLPRTDSYYISDPLVLDLDGNGIETVGINGADSILFDHKNEGIRTGSGWVKKEDALLTVDLNGDGIIDSGRELLSILNFI